ncbi:MAG TPA: hypothetical protein VID25_12970 [Candidatus Limnocylindrales bacterium]|jgi:hypothetical protein
MSRRIDDGLAGAWIPDPAQPDAERWASMEISPAGWLRFIILDGGTIRHLEHDYSVPDHGTLEVREDDGTLTRQVYRLEEPGPVLILDGRRFIRAIDPTDRPWPAIPAPEPLAGA